MGLQELGGSFVGCDGQFNKVIMWQCMRCPKALSGLGGV